MGILANRAWLGSERSVSAKGGHVDGAFVAPSALTKTSKRAGDIAQEMEKLRIGLGLDSRGNQSFEFGAQLAGVPSASLEAMVKAAFANRPTHYSADGKIGFALLGRWAKEDPDSAFVFALGLSGGVYGSPMWAFGAALADHSDATLDAFEARIEGRAERAAFVSGLISGLKRSDPAKALEVFDRNEHLLSSIASGGSTSGGGYMIRRYGSPPPGLSRKDIMLAIATRDPVAASRMLEDMEEKERRAMVGSIASQWGRKDFAEAKQWIASLPGESERESALNDALRGLVESDFAEGIRQIKAANPEQLQRVTVGKVFETWIAVDTAAAIEWISSLPVEQRKMLRPSGGFGRDIAEPDLIVDWFVRDPVSSGAGSLALAALIQMARDDINGVAERIEELPDGKLKKYARINILNQMVAQEPAAIARYVETADVLQNENTVKHLAAGWSTHDLPAAAKWAAGMEPGPLRDSAIESIRSGLEGRHGRAPIPRWETGEALEGLAEIADLTDVERTQLTIAALSRPGAFDAPLAKSNFSMDWFSAEDAAIRSQATTLAVQIAGRIATNNPAEAIEWSFSLGHEEATNSGISAAVREWASDAPGEVSAWLVDADLGSARDGAVNSLVTKIASTDPPAAFQWALTINEDWRRTNSTQRAVTKWAETDPAAAAAAVAAAGLDTKATETLMGIVARAQ